MCELPTCGECGEIVGEPMNEEQCVMPGCGRHFHVKCFADHWHDAPLSQIATAYWVRNHN